MKQASMTFQVVSLNFHLYSMPTLKVLKTKRRNNTPWTGPSILVPVRSPIPYFKGTATKISSNRETPSRYPIRRKRPICVVNRDFIIYLKNGLLASGENGHGMAIKIMSRATAYQISMVLNFSLSVCILLDSADPIVTNTIAVNIRVLWINPKNTRSRFFFASLKW